MDPVKAMYDRRTKELIFEATRKNFYKPKEIRFRASELAACPRQIYHRLVGDRPLPTAPRLGDYNSAGDAAQDICRQRLVDAGIPVGGVEFTDQGQIETTSKVGTFTHKGVDIKIAARLDGMLEYGDHKGILEIKSVGYWKYDGMCKAFTSKGEQGLRDHITKKYLSYIWQMEASMRINGESEGYLLIYDRGEARIGVRNTRDDTPHGGFWLEADDERWEQILNKLVRIHNAVKNRAALRPGELPGSTACQRCAYQYACHEAIDRRQRGIEPAVVYPFPLEDDNE